uniref:Uncharacterized protein AlNc14C25G2496 n=1 Tax=Albugo laibachii Nc14 TaxID=890382 RepID=F0W6K7_9STRA|nr:hypothetical protein PITG_01583 [Albugo laibachii Nc14]|eukprot:CCA16752.1 hypothetical protein PITG_01583 [Albugo laibachii Nc14]
MAEEDDLIILSFFSQKKDLGLAIYEVTTTHLKILETHFTSLDVMKDLIERVISQFGVSLLLISSRMETSVGIISWLQHYNDQNQSQIQSRIVKEQHPSLVKVRVSDASVSIHPHVFTFRFREQEDRNLGLRTNYHVNFDILQENEKKSRLNFVLIDRLFGLLNRTITTRGSKMLRNWMLAPLTDPVKISQRLDTVQFFSDQSNEEVRTNLVGLLLQGVRHADCLRSTQVDQLKQFRDISGIFLKIRHRSASSRDWCNLYRSTVSFIASRSYIQEIVESRHSSMIILFQQFLEETGGSQISNLLGNIIDVEESSASNSIVIHEGVSEQLDDARIRYNHLDNVLSEVAYQICERSPSLRGITVQYIPQVGYVICCDSPTVLPDFVFQFQEDDNTFYYKVVHPSLGTKVLSLTIIIDECCRELDESIGDIFDLIDLEYSLETANLSQSSFTIDCSQLTRMLHQCDRHSLLLVDEFGKGTSELDGLSLLSSTINHLTSRVSKDGGPRVLITTHQLQKIITEKLVPYWNDNNGSQEKNQIAPFFTLLASDGATNTPLYTVQLGIADGSNAIGCAVSSGIPEESISRARDVLQLMRQGAHIPPQSVSVSRYVRFCQQLSSTFYSVPNWIDASDEEIDKLALIARLTD